MMRNGIIYDETIMTYEEDLETNVAYLYIRHAISNGGVMVKVNKLTLKVFSVSIILDKVYLNNKLQEGIEKWNLKVKLNQFVNE